MSCLLEVTEMKALLLPPATRDDCHVKTQQERQRNQVGVRSEKLLRCLESPSETCNLSSLIVYEESIYFCFSVSNALR